MVRAAGHSCVASPLPVALETWVDVVAALGGLHENELDAGNASGGEIDILLVSRHIDSLHRQGTSWIDTRMRPAVTVDRCVEASWSKPEEPTAEADAAREEQTCG
ncbi:MAG: hypothetical protein ABS35_25280 [Kaistia sp. SCN 65-12]|nr:MAG: hypothetical protein ABS35_25280 [Kaistia sp. SCN 65-12]